MKILKKIIKAPNEYSEAIILFLARLAKFSIAILIIIGFGAYSKLLLNQLPLTEFVGFLFGFLFSLLSSYYIAMRISIWSSRKNQKIIANNAIRHLRNSMREIYSLKNFIKTKIPKIEDDLVRQYFSETKNRLDGLYYSIIESQTDFNSFVTDEINQEKLLAKELAEINRRIFQIESDLKQKPKETANLEELISQLSQTKAIFNEKLTSLPFGPTGPTGMPTGSIDINDIDDIPFQDAPGPSGPVN